MTSQDFNFDSDFGARYDSLIRNAVFGYDALFSMILALLATRVYETARVLVVGSGTGTELITFGSQMQKWELVGVDPSEQMVRLSRAKLESQQLQDRARVVQGTIERLADAPEFDAATLILVLHFLPDDGAKRSLLNNIANRLKNGASFVLVDLGGDPESEQYRHLMEGWKKYMIRMGMAAEAVDALMSQAAQTQHFIPEARVLDLLHETGFRKLERFYGAFLHNGWIAEKA